MSGVRSSPAFWLALSCNSNLSIKASTAFKSFSKVVTSSLNSPLSSDKTFIEYVICPLSDVYTIACPCSAIVSSLKGFPSQNTSYPWLKSSLMACEKPWKAVSKLPCVRFPPCLVLLLYTLPRLVSLGMSTFCGGAESFMVPSLFVVGGSLIVHLFST